MYVVGQFPNFLINHWPFLRTVIKKLNEFMHEKHPGVQDMASETFLKISKLTKQMFVRQIDSQQPYVIDLINMIPENCKDLQPHQRLQVYEGIGYMISAEETNQQQYLFQLLSYCHNDWQQLINMARQNPNCLSDSTVIKQIDFIIKINQRVAQSVGKGYIAYLKDIFNDMIEVYKLYSQCISNLTNSTQQESLRKSMKAVRRDILRLIQTYIESESEFTFFNMHFLPTLQAMV